MTAMIPIPKVPIVVRAAAMSDLPFIDGLQKGQTKQVGWMPRGQLEAKIGRGQVLVAEEVVSCKLLVASGDAEGVASCELPVASENGPEFSSLTTNNSQLTTSPIGYCIGTDQYFKRDDVGIIYQMNVAPGHRRGLVGATLLRAMFDRAAYGCRLFCCWCAQDIEANRFWEAMGFVPLAFRTGSAKRGRGGGAGRGRVHIFWQRRIRAGDVTTPYWFPAQTSAGSIREDRLVLPIPPGMHWSEVMPVVLPTISEEAGTAAAADRTPRLADRTKHKTKRTPRSLQPARETSKILLHGLRFAPTPDATPQVAPEPKPEPKREPKPKPPRVKVKNDPKHVAAARELRDRWLERVNADPSVLLSQGKYDVTRTIGHADDGASAPALPPVTNAISLAA